MTGGFNYLIVYNKGSDFDYLCVLDFEAQCSNDDKLEVQVKIIYLLPLFKEIVEFPVVVVNVKTNEIEHFFHYYIKPVVHPIIFPFCTELTGITQQHVEKGITIEEAVTKLEVFLREKVIFET